MAVVSLPPRGPIYDAQRRRELRIREMTTVDPVERYKLREARLNENMISVAAALINDAKKNKVTAEMLKKSDD